jgi:hypothetical protein
MKTYMAYIRLTEQPFRRPRRSHHTIKRTDAKPSAFERDHVDYTLKQG